MTYEHQREITGLTAERDWEKTRADRLLEAIQKHYDANGHDLCWINDDTLYAAAGLPPKRRALPPKEEFTRECERYRDEIYEIPVDLGGSWDEHIERTRKAIDAIKERRGLA